uniref:Uncharacterized protein n=1 Tax=Strigamia maritima TaxID=126957 RepID=T1J7V5_STRMM
MATRKQQFKMNQCLKSLKYFMLGLFFDVLYFLPIILSLPLLLMFVLFRYFLGIYLTIKHRQKIHFIPGPDAIFLLNTNEMIIHGFLIIKGVPDLQDIRNRVKNTLTNPTNADGSFKYARLRSVMKTSCGFAYWLLVDSFCLENHVWPYPCTPPINENELYQMLTQISNEFMPIGQPSWLINILTLSKNYYGSDHYVLLLRFHHTITDAVSALRLLAHCFFDTGIDKLMSSRSYLKLRKNPNKISLLKLVQSMFLVPYYLTKQMVQQDRNILHGRRLSGIKLCRMSTPVSLDRVKIIKAVTDTTVNDVLLSCVGAALKAHFKTEEVVAPRKVHAALAVTFHAMRDEPELKNKCSSVTFKFRMETCSSLANLMNTHKQMTKLKTKLFLPINLMCVSLVNIIPSCLTWFPMRFIGTTFILSNVAGPQVPCYNNGNIIVRFAGFVPHINRTGIGITLFSFNGKIYFAMSVDDAIISNVKIVDRFLNSCVQEVDKLEKELVL